MIWICNHIQFSNFFIFQLQFYAILIAINGICQLSTIHRILFKMVNSSVIKQIKQYNKTLRSSMDDGKIYGSKNVIHR